MDKTSLEEHVAVLLSARHLKLGLAESCTGGLIGHRLTNVAGSSAFFVASIVAYAYEAKEALLGVSHDVLVRDGAVSEAVVMAMARGVCRALSVDIGLAVTGIAGPGGATPTKPVGLTYIGLVAPGAERARRYVWSGDRISNKEQSAEAALSLLLDYLQEST
jgi:PncC family amidohydrolase